MRQIYTYANPLTMNKDKIIWDMIKQYPQFCASDTLVQGMTQFYGRHEFGIIQTVNDLQKLLVGDLTNNVQFDMQLFLDVSHEVRKMDSESNIQKSFRSDMSEVVSAIRYLLFLEADSKKLLEIENASMEQIELFKVYDSLIEKYKASIQTILNKDKEEVKREIRNTVISEAEYIAKINHEYLGEEDYHCADLEGARKKLLQIKKSIESEISERQNDGYVNTAKEKGKIFRVDYAVSLIEKINIFNVDTIIIHGVHKFTPEILLMMHLLEQVGINIVFLIHYVDKLPQVYGTWREVYSWMHLDFNNVHDFDLNIGSNTGKEMAKVMSGSLSGQSLLSYKAEYDNLSSFSVGEVRNTFRQASEKLGQMKVQYYAVNNSDTNEILKNYFPDQFEIKPFLSYPIGQFILGLYLMWDFDNSSMKYVPEALRECVVAGVFENEVGRDISEIFEDLSPYLEDLENIEQVKDRLVHLIEERNFIDRNSGKGLDGLISICYFSRNEKEINSFIRYIELLENLSSMVFLNNKDQINFNVHFKNLMEVLAEPLSNVSIVHKAELQLAQELLSVLSEKRKVDIVGDFSDVKDALSFFLHQNKVDDSSNWIVRNFEQIDGAVLLADKSKAKEYHFALLSMKNMAKNSLDELPWPLTEKVFYGYDCELESAMHASAICNKERANFLKYSLFFGTFFFKKKITFSYIMNQNGEIQRPYYIFNLLKLRQLPQENNEDINFGTSNTSISEEDFDFESLSIEQKEMFAICKYKYFLFRVLNERIIYRNEFQIKYFLTNYITQVIMDNSKLSTENQDGIVTKYMELFRDMFPNYDAIAFGDIDRKVRKEVSNSLKYSKDNNSPQKHSTSHKRRKRNFLLAKWEDSMKFDAVDKREVVDYMIDDNILLSIENRPHLKVCENCNYYADCLMKYYEGVQRKEEDD